jgi:hypothetical protein
VFVEVAVHEFVIDEVLPAEGSALPVQLHMGVEFTIVHHLFPSHVATIAFL